MDTTTHREKRAKRIYIGFATFYCLLSAVLVVLYGIRRDFYHMGISLGTFAFPILLELVWRLPDWNRVWQLNGVILGFVFVAYPLGSCVDLFHWLPGFDKVAHTLSGPFVGILALMLYYSLKPGHGIERGDMALAICFMLTTSIAVAGLWEIGEYLVSGIVGRDLQEVAATGVADSMQDMIVCTLGTLVLLPVPYHLCRGQRGLFSDMVRDFVAIQFGN